MSKSETLHSRYNPKGEAERYINSLNLAENLGLFILIEPGMGYMVDVLRNKFPNSKIISLHAEAPEYIHKENQPDAFWSPETGISLRSFLEQQIPDMEAKDLKIIEWRPSLLQYGQAYHFLLAETAEFIKQVDASTRTIKQFGKRWFKNFFRNLALISETIIPLPFSFPLVITGAGPSLEDTIPVMRKNRQDFFLVAVSSSVMALKNNKLEPDLVITTDGGNWALLHLFECFRPNTEKMRLAFNWNATLPSQCKNAGLMIISDGSLWQELILKELNIPFIVMPQRGTVTASALDLALSLTTETIYFTGIDLSHKGIQTHAKPYSFDRLWEEKASMCNPCYSQIFKRSVLMEAGGSHSVYASWFSKQIELYPKRLRSLGSNNKVFNSLEQSEFELNNVNKGKRPEFKTVSLNFDESPAEKAISILKKALSNPMYEQKLKEELTSLLGPDGIDFLDDILGRAYV